MDYKQSPGSVGNWPAYKMLRTNILSKAKNELHAIKGMQDDTIWMMIKRDYFSL